MSHEDIHKEKVINRAKVSYKSALKVEKPILNEEYFAVLQKKKEMAECYRGYTAEL